jgi:hypothetical protein
MGLMTRRKRPTLAAIRENPLLHPRAFALVQARFPGLKWHFFADSPDSSQAFALSAFLPVLEFPDKDAILERFVTQALTGVAPRAGRSWQVIPEYEDARLLGETGRGEPTKVDMFLVAEDAVVCVEAKFRVDARQGWGRCTQPPRLCEGFHGRGSDRKGTQAACRLELPDGDRGPRLYWHLAHGRFRDEVLAEQRPGEACPFLTDYQLVRNYLFAAEHARREGKADHGVIGIAPRDRVGLVAAGVERFRRTVLVATGAERVAAATYEQYLAILAAGSAEARELVAFLAPLLSASGPQRLPLA